MNQRLSHLNSRGEAHMVDVGAKAITRRKATASGWIRMANTTLALLADGQLPKGDVLATARIAAIQAAKKTSELIPLCHALPLSSVKVGFELDQDLPGVRISATCHVEGRTGVEMEALTAVSVAGLTLYDMCKAVDKAMVIGAIQLETKEGGASGDWVRPSDLAVTEASYISDVDPSPVTPSVDANIGGLMDIRFFAALRESLGVDHLQLEWNHVNSTVSDLKASLAKLDGRYASLQEKNVLVAINRRMAREDSPVHIGDEVGFFPPVTGG